MNDNEYNLNIVIIGDPYVGKTNLLRWFLGEDFDQFSTPTIGADFKAFSKVVKDESVSIKFWDSAG